MKVHVKSERAQITRPVAVSAAGALIFLILYYVMPFYRWLFQLGWIVCLSVALFQLIRHGMAEYIYQIEEDGIYIIRVSGKNQYVQNVILHENYGGLTDYAGIDWNKELFFNYCVSRNPKGRIVIILQNSVCKQKYVVLEAGGEFAGKIEEWAKKGPPPKE